jgi:hypothetical protein
MMKQIVILLTLMAISVPALSSALGSVRCGTKTVGELYAEGWRIEKQDYIRNLGDGENVILLEDGTAYRADVTIGMFAGDPAILLSKYVKSDKVEAFIFTICAGGVDAWVTPIM